MGEVLAAELGADADPGGEIEDLPLQFPVPEGPAQQTADGLPVRCFRTLLVYLATLVRYQLVPKLPGALSFTVVTRPTPLKWKAPDRLEVRP